MNYYELMQDFEISLIETLNEKEKELSNLCKENKEQFERFLIKLKFQNNTADISNFGNDDLKDFNAYVLKIIMQILEYNY